MSCNIPFALAEISKGRDHLKTAEFARVIGKSSQTIRKLHCLNGQAFGIRPVKIGNSLLWSVDSIARLLNGEGVMLRLPSFGKGYIAYEAAKRWLYDNYPELTNSEREQLHRVAANMAGV